MNTRAFPGERGGLVPSTASGLIPTSWTMKQFVGKLSRCGRAEEREREGVQRKGSCVPHRQSHYVDKLNGAYSKGCSIREL